MKVMTEKKRPLGREQHTARVPVVTWRAWRPIARTIARTLVMVLAVTGVLLEAPPSWARGGYRVALTPVNDPATGNFKVRLAGERVLMAHVVTTPDNTDAAGVTVHFYTNLGTSTVSPGTGVTDASGTTGVTLWGGWEPGTATVRARVIANGTNYDDVAVACSACRRTGW